MLKFLLSFMVLIFLSSCGGFQTQHPQRSLASISESLDVESRELENKLDQIHSYHMIAQRELNLFDKSVNKSSSSTIYQSSPYLRLQATRSLIEEIEKDLIDLLGGSDKELWTTLHFSKKEELLKRITQFAQQSKYHALSMNNLLRHLIIDDFPMIDESLSSDEVNEEMKRLSEGKTFHVFDQNIEHLSHMLGSSTMKNQNKFQPSTTSKGNISGDEFPAKVWSITFDDGPKNKLSLALLKELNNRKIKATFFQLAKNVLSEKKIAKNIKDSGMEIATHSFTHQQLTKAGGAELENEIFGAVNRMNKTLSMAINFYRLPFGAGLDNHTIREKIAENGLIHVHWNVDTLDWVPQESDRIVQRAKKLIKKTKRDAGIIVFHDTHERSVKSAPLIMDFLMQENRRVCTIGEVVKQMNMGLHSVCQSK